MGKKDYKGTILDGRDSYDSWKMDLDDSLLSDDLMIYVTGKPEAEAAATAEDIKNTSLARMRVRQSIDQMHKNIVETKDDLATKDAEIERLKILQRTANLVAFRGYKYDTNEDGLPIGQAYCPVCEQKDGMLFHLSYFMGENASICLTCKSRFDAERLTE